MPLKRNRRRPIYTTDEFGDAIVMVPLKDGTEGPYATCFAHDYQYLTDILGFNPHWCVDESYYSPYLWYVRTDEKTQVLIKRKISIARLIMDAHAGEVIRHIDGDRLNNKATNLVIARSKAGKDRPRELTNFHRDVLLNAP